MFLGGGNAGQGGYGVVFADLVSANSLRSLACLKRAFRLQTAEPVARSEKDLAYNNFDQTNSPHKQLGEHLLMGITIIFLLALLFNTVHDEPFIPQ